LDKNPKLVSCGNLKLAELKVVEAHSTELGLENTIVSLPLANNDPKFQEFPVPVEPIFTEGDTSIALNTVSPTLTILAEVMVCEKLIPIKRMVQRVVIDFFIM